MQAFPGTGPACIPLFSATASICFFSLPSLLLLFPSSIFYHFIEIRRIFNPFLFVMTRSAYQLFFGQTPENCAVSWPCTREVRPHALAALFDARRAEFSRHAGSPHARLRNSQFLAVCPKRMQPPRENRMPRQGNMSQTGETEQLMRKAAAAMIGILQNFLYLLFPGYDKIIL